MIEILECDDFPINHAGRHSEMARVWFLIFLTICVADPAQGQQSSAAPSKLTSEQSEFFEKKIRPVLVKSCYECHSEGAQADNQLKGGLLLDSREGTLTGGDSGPAVELGKPDESLLLEAMRYETIKMPPKGKLPDAIIADFEAWVKMGAPDPRIGKVPTKPTGIDITAGRQHWSYRRLQASVIPQVTDQTWPATPIDRFILAGLEAKDLQPVIDADRQTLVRRVYFDLIGLPPTPKQIDEFVNDAQPDAYERLIDGLLASPRFGERWGRHWLDVVRYAESLTLRGFVMPEAWRYRDYVIDTFNADRPYDQFLREQVAGDLLPASTLADKQRQNIATTFLVLGNTNLEEQDKVQLRMDVVDEQLDVITKGFLAQTVTCARCHDHKFDPIPTRDYYAMAGILRNAKTLEHANVSKWLELPLPVDGESDSKFQQHETLVAGLQKQIAEAKEMAKALAVAEGQNVGATTDVVAAKDLPGVVIDDSQAKKVGEWKLSQFSKRYIGDGYLHDLDGDKGTKTLTFQPELPKAGVYEVRLAYSPGANRTTDAPVTIFSADGEKTVQINETLQPPIDGRFISLGQFRFEQNGQGFVIVANEGTKGHVIADAVQFISAEATDANPATTLPVSEVPKAKTVAVPGASKQRANEVKRLEKELRELVASGPQRPRFMSVQEEKKIEDCSIHIRGTVHNLGDVVPRGFLSVIEMSDTPTLPSDQSGRKELGDWLSNPENPLPARVMANRVWHWLIGSGLVRTTDNFGTTGEAPSHPELLDHLATQFMSHAWSVKSIVRQIVLSRVYRLSSIASPELAKDDPENRLLGRAHRKRQDAECLLDSILAASGQIDLYIGGPTIKPGTAADFGYEFKLTRRAIYWPVFRNALPEIFEAFDFPESSMVSGRRNISTVAPQALFLLNSPFLREQGLQSAIRLMRDEPSNENVRLELAFRRLLGRLPTEAERTTARKYLQPESEISMDEKTERWVELVQALFGSVDFRFVD